MFVVEKARSANTYVEFVKINISELIRYIDKNLNYEVHNNSWSQYIIRQFAFPISEKANIYVRKILNRKRKNFSGLTVTLKYLAFFDSKEPIYWSATFSFDQNLKLSKITNYNLFSINKQINSEKEKEFYIVFDGGFNTHDMYKNPYFLSKKEFDYVYTTIL